MIHRQYLDWGDPGRQRIHEYADDGTPDGLWVDTYFDGLGRIYQVIKKGDVPNTTFITQRNYNDASGRVHTRAEWFPSGTKAPPVETFNYDEAGRMVKKTHADGTTERLVHDADANGVTKRVTNERGIVKTIALDAHNRVASVTQRDQATAQTAIVRYSYNTVGELVTVTDANGNITTNAWE